MGIVSVLIPIGMVCATFGLIPIGTVCATGNYSHYLLNPNGIHLIVTGHQRIIEYNNDIQPTHYFERETMDIIIIIAKVVVALAVLKAVVAVDS